MRAAYRPVKKCRPRPRAEAQQQERGGAREQPTRGRPRKRSTSPISLRLEACPLFYALEHTHTQLHPFCSAQAQPLARRRQSVPAVCFPFRCRSRADLTQRKQNPPPYIDAAPLPENILEWCVAAWDASCRRLSTRLFTTPPVHSLLSIHRRHYCLSGLEDCPYSGGYYHGKVRGAIGRATRCNS